MLTPEVTKNKNTMLLAANPDIDAGSGAARSHETAPDPYELAHIAEHYGNKYDGLVARAVDSGLTSMQVDDIETWIEHHGIDTKSSAGKDRITLYWGKELADHIKYNSPAPMSKEEFRQLHAEMSALVSDMLEGGVLDGDSPDVAEDFSVNMIDYYRARLALQSAVKPSVKDDNLIPPAYDTSSPVSHRAGRHKGGLVKPRHAGKESLIPARERADITRLRYERKYLGMSFDGRVERIATDPSPLNDPDILRGIGHLYRHNLASLDRTSLTPQQAEQEVQELLGDWSSYVAGEIATESAPVKLEENEETRRQKHAQEAERIAQELLALRVDHFNKEEDTEILARNVERYKQVDEELQRRTDAYGKNRRMARLAVGAVRGVKNALSSPGTLVASIWARLETKKAMATPEQMARRRRAAKVISFMVLGYTLANRTYVGHQYGLEDIISTDLHHATFDLIGNETELQQADEEHAATAETPQQEAPETPKEDKKDTPNNGSQWIEQPPEESKPDQKGREESGKPERPEEPDGNDDHYTMTDNKAGYKGHPDSLTDYADLIMEEHGFDKDDPGYTKERDKVVQSLIDTNDTYHGKSHWIHRGQEIDLSAGHEVAEGFEDNGGEAGGQQEAPTGSSPEVPEGYPTDIGDHLSPEQLDALRLRNGDGGESLLRRLGINPDRWQQVAPQLAEKYPKDIYQVGIDTNGDGAADSTDYRLNMTRSGYLNPSLAADLAKSLRIWR